MTEKKITVTERLNAISFDNLTKEDYDYLMERARKSVRKVNPENRKPTKKQLETQALREKVVEVLRGLDEPVSKADLAEMVEVAETRVSALLAGVEGVERIVKKEGKKTTTYYSM